ncbi:sigma 54-interacting transcriptional regulator [Clostridium sp. D2Q-11]|uniref:Sigma 54-interacting transcriptional regulator n=1 Tax=Anaeromonas frigoriresistens TaxID=2683708 RepID=A0A942UZU6_9FIRM|nr:sigma 54-interacting transcriptional regulator [Anaeromonas frigoriresistens]MBS4540071.1 sigma 54-interacting transcriptional regulator [Anaeromonas frigoriresistens]
MKIESLILPNILQYLDEGIHVIDKEGKTIIYNEAMEQLEGIERKNIIGKQLLEIFPSLDEESSTLFTVMKTGRAIINRGQTYLNYKGEKISSVNTTIPIFYKEDLIGAVEIGRDVTKIKKLSEELLELRSELNNKSVDKVNVKSKQYTFDNIIGKTDNFKKAINIAKKASNSSSSVLIYGETGTGKELFAQSIHYSGSRKKYPFVAQNCAALPEQLLEGILFGTVKGGFTGAIDRPGLFEQANGGTLLLDEINSMGMTLQSKLLRVLQEGYIRRVGGLKDIPVDVKIIATTNESPKEAIENGRLRKDLYYRLNVIYVNIPTLRERIGDLNLLVEAFIRKYNRRLDKDVWMISRDVKQLFNNYNWPGNVRELENMIEGAMNFIATDEHVLQLEHFPDYIKDFNSVNKEIQKDIMNINKGESLNDTLSMIEKSIIKDELIKWNYNISATARGLNIKRQTLQHKLKKYEII